MNKQNFYENPEVILLQMDFDSTVCSTSATNESYENDTQNDGLIF